MKCLEIFSGAGGLAKGLENAGFEHASFVEINRDACATLRKNFPPALVYEGDIATFDLSALGTVDIVAGGPPCQPFSLGGRHKAQQDSRDLFPHAVRCIESLQPKAFLFENVKGLLRPSFAKYFEYILLRLAYPHCRMLNGEYWREHLARLQQITPKSYDGIRYDVQFKLLNAADFGVPQKRERVLLVGIRSDLSIKWKFPEPTHSEDRLHWEKYVTGAYWQRHGMAKQNNDALQRSLRQRYGLFEPKGQPWQTVRDALKNVPGPQDAHGIPDHIFRDGARTYPGHTGSEIDQPAKTLKAGGHGVPGGENMIRYEDGSVRYFTVYEAKLMQTFPEDFAIVGAWGEAMRQLGNAVPVALAELFGKKLFALLSHKQTLMKCNEVRVHPVTSRSQVCLDSMTSLH
jgi:DNA (cytosine-5)-methyltransferase 1